MRAVLLALAVLVAGCSAPGATINVLTNTAVGEGCYVVRGIDTGVQNEAGVSPDNKRHLAASRVGCPLPD